MKIIKNELVNNTPFSMDEIAAMQRLGTTVNNWRQRNVILFQHPTEETNVVSMGTTFDGRLTVIAVESKTAWTTELDYASRGKVYVSH